MWSAESPDRSITIFRDDFNDQDINWVWTRVEGTGTIMVSDGYVFLKMTDETSQSLRSFAFLNDVLERRGTQWLYVGLEIVLRCSDDNKLDSDIGGGIRGWGFTTLYGLTGIQNQLRFLSFSPESDWGGLWAADGNMYLMEPLTGIDIREWHTYTILWEPGNATFLVDGEAVAITDSPAGVPMGIWIFSESTKRNGPSLQESALGWLDLTVNETIQVDYVHVFAGKERYEEFSEETAGKNSDEMTRLFTDAERLVEEINERGMNVQEMRDEFSKAEDAWDKFHYIRAKFYLEKIISDATNLIDYCEIVDNDMFNLTLEIIEEGKQSGLADRTINMMEGWYASAQNSWAEDDCSETKMYLEKIMAISEITVPILMLTLLIFLEVRLSIFDQDCWKQDETQY